MRQQLEADYTQKIKAIQAERGAEKQQADSANDSHADKSWTRPAAKSGGGKSIG